MTNSFIRNLYLSNSQNLLLVALFHILANIFKINMWQHFSFCHLCLADFFPIVYNMKFMSFICQGILV